MSSNVNPGYAFPLEKLGSDVARNQFNYESILNGLVAWNNTTEDEVTIRLTMGTSPYYWDYRIPSKKSIINSSSFECVVEGAIQENNFSMDCRIVNTLYGGSREILESVFDAPSGVDDGTDIITFDDLTGWGEGDVLQFQKTDVADVLPTPLQEGVLYQIVNISGNNAQIQTNDTVPVLVNLTSQGSGIIKSIKKEFNPISLSSDPGDVATLRMSVESSGDCDWSVNYIELVNDWTIGADYRWGNLVTYDDGSGVRLYRAVFDIVNADGSDTPDTSINWEPWVVDFVLNDPYTQGQKVSFNGSIYTVLNSIANALQNPDIDTINFELYAEAWVSGNDYNDGAYVAYEYLPYIAKTQIFGSPTPPDLNDDWLFAVTEIVPSSTSFNSSVVFKWQLMVDVSGFILKCLGPLDFSKVDTNISFRLSARNIEAASIYQRSVESFPTSNYSFWPSDLNKVWEDGNTYGPADTGIGVNNRQDYSAVMVFDHTRQDIAKTVNFINYDGPDLDKGLCIYLPVEVNVGDGGVAMPEDGFTYEFYFRIWPKASLNGSTTRDHIINKSQIYVFNALSDDGIPDDSCSSPVAKFSMGRMTNFYMFGENISIPDKPVHYRATFIYNATDKKWHTLDYYQLPDHLFVGPVGFIDPQNPSNLDINNDALGNINPNAQFIGYETAGFPMFQDPFSNSDLSPYQTTTDEDLDSFENRIS